jgi:hypothetical protein
MSRTTANQKMAVVAAGAQDGARVVVAKVKPIAAQVPPLAKSTQAAAQRGLYHTRVWVAPQLERGGQVLQDSVAPKVSEFLSVAAHRIEPDEPRRRRWPLLSGISFLIAVALGAAAAAVVRKRKTSASTIPAAEEDTGEAAPSAPANGQPETSASTDPTGAARTS